MVKPVEVDGWTRDAESIFLFHWFVWGPILGPIALSVAVGAALIFRRSPEEKAMIRRLIDGFGRELEYLKELNTRSKPD